MKVLAIIIIVVGVIGIIMAGAMFGDIGLAAGVGAVTAILSGVGFLLIERKLKKLAPNEGK
jgi:uncharacterized membrane protein